MSNNRPGFFENTFGRIATVLITNLDLLLSIGIWAISVSFYSKSINEVDRNSLIQVAGSLVLVTIGVAAFFGRDKEVIEKIASKRTWIFAAYLPALTAGVAILFLLLDFREIGIFFFIYSIISTLGVSYSILKLTLKLPQKS